MRLALELIDAKRLSPGRVMPAEELAASMAQEGLRLPVVVVGWPEALTPGHYSAIAGRRRVQAARALGWREIDAFELDLDTYQVFRSLTDPARKHTLSRQDRRDGFTRLLGACAGDRAATIDLLGVSQTTFYRTIAGDRVHYTNWSPTSLLSKVEAAGMKMSRAKRAELTGALLSMAARLADDRRPH